MVLLWLQRVLMGFQENQFREQSRNIAIKMREHVLTKPTITLPLNLGGSNIPSFYTYLQTRSNVDSAYSCVYFILLISMWKSLMAECLEKTSQCHEMYYHYLEVMSSNSSCIVRGRDGGGGGEGRTWTKNINVSSTV